MIMGAACGGGTHEAEGVKGIRRVTFLGLCLAVQAWQFYAGLERPGNTQTPAQ